MKTRVFALLLALAVCSCSGSGSTTSSEGKADPNEAPPPPRRGPQRLEFNSDAAAFEAALADLDAQIVKTEERAAQQTGSWLVLDKLAKLHISRARLSGSYDDYAAAEDALARAFERAPEGAGPVLTRAALNFTLHRLDPIEADLALVDAMVVVDDPTRAYVASLRGDVAFERGNYALARQHYDASLELDRNAAILAKLAQWHWRAGAFEQAETLYAEAEAEMSEDALESRAWVHLQLGIMDLERGRSADAFADYRDGARLLGGWWLIEEHIAEIAVRMDMPAFALELYTDIIARTGKGEFMDAKAQLLLDADDEAGAKSWIEQAETVYEAQLEQFPEASYGHALGHYLDFGPPARALELAEANHELRPGVPAKIALAEARLGVGDVSGARAIIDEALDTTWVSADLSWVASQVYTALGDTARAAQLRAEAEALHPTIAADS